MGLPGNQNTAAISECISRNWYCIQICSGGGRDDRATIEEGGKEVGKEMVEGEGSGVEDEGRMGKVVWRDMEEGVRKWGRRSRKEGERWGE